MRLIGLVILAVSLAIAPLATEGQPPGKMYKIGVLCLVVCEGPEVDGLRVALRELGYVEGRTVDFEYRAAGGDLDRLHALAAELAKTKVDLIFTPFGTAAPLAAKRATTTIPVVMAAAGDPVKAGIVQSLARPGGNVTGLSSVALDLEAKRFSLLKELVPGISRVGVFWDPQNPFSALAVKQDEMAAGVLGVQLSKVLLRAPSDLGNAFAALKRDGVQALCVQGYAAPLKSRTEIIAFAAANRLPAIYIGREYVARGGLMSYGSNLGAISRRAAGYVDRILKGTKPSELPVEQASELELVVNMKTAKALDLTIPQTLLLRADQVIE
jgi:putative ABC transport system substrate-binding protein